MAKTNPALGGGTAGDITINLQDELLERIAQRAAELVAAQPAEPEGYLDVAGAAKFLACPTSRIYSLVSSKRIPHHRDGTRLIFDRAELREYVNNGGARRP